jgi:NAD-dependent SIR2 family protein deacetylase
MRCLACNVELNDYEATRKDKENNFIDLCNYCYNTVKDDITVINNHDTNIVDSDIYDDLLYNEE